MKKIIQVSLLAIWIACPALAENFPNDGYMLENKTYTNAATYDNMGIYEGSVDAEAEYNDCPQNSYCDTTGQHSCPSGYPNSAAGSSESTQCYTACTVQNANIAHATAVSGNDYNGGTDTCSATACENGWHTKSSTLADIIGSANGVEVAYINDIGHVVGNVSTYGLSDHNSFVVNFGARGVVTGHAICSEQQWAGSNPYDNVTADENGHYCYCSIENYTPSGGSTIPFAVRWVGNSSYSPSLNCWEGCIHDCVSSLEDIEYDSQGRSALLNSVLRRNICEANEITINWSDVDGEENPFATNVTYDGDIDTPVKAATYPGKIFTGWRFVRPDDEYGS